MILLHWLNQHKLIVFLDMFGQSQTSIQHNYLCDLMNMKENIFSSSEEWVNNCWWGWQNWQNSSREM